MVHPVRAQITFLATLGVGGKAAAQSEEVISKRTARSGAGETLYGFGQCRVFVDCAALPVPTGGEHLRVAGTRGRDGKNSRKSTGAFSLASHSKSHFWLESGESVGRAGQRGSLCKVSISGTDHNPIRMLGYCTPLPPWKSPRTPGTGFSRPRTRQCTTCKPGRRGRGGRDLASPPRPPKSCRARLP